MISLKLRYVLGIALCLLLITEIYPQGTSAPSTKKIFRKGENALGRSDFLNAFKLFSEVIEKEPDNYEAIYNAGLCLFSLNERDTVTLKYFAKVKDKEPDAHFYISRIYHLLGHTRKALEELFFYKSVMDGEDIEYEEVERWIRTYESELTGETKKENYIVKNLGERINTKYPEYVPLVWNVNGALVFTSRRNDSKGGKLDPYGRFYEDIYLAQRSGDDWMAPLPISDDINSSTHDACVAFSPSGKELIIYRTDARQTGGDFYISTFDSVRWSEPVKMGPEINSEYLEASACFSADGNEIIFSSNRPGGHGGKDLYKIVKFMNGKYSLPFNLGPTINTAQDEDAPFIDKRDNALYFSSRGHNTMGEYDIFRSEYNADLTRWLKAENLGLPINSANDDIYFMKLDDKDIAMFASRRDGGFGDADIYEVNFEETSEMVIYCRIKSGKENDSLYKDMQLSLYDYVTGKLQGLYRPNKTYKSMVLVVEKDKPYKMILEGSMIDPVIKKVWFTNEKETEFEVKAKE